MCRAIDDEIEAMQLQTFQKFKYHVNGYRNAMHGFQKEPDKNMENVEKTISIPIDMLV